MSSCVEAGKRNLSQLCQTDITFSDCTAKYLPVEKVYFHILEKIQEAFFDLKSWDCSFDKDVNPKSGDTLRDTIIRRACKRSFEPEPHVSSKISREEDRIESLTSNSSFVNTDVINTTNSSKTVTAPTKIPTAFLDNVSPVKQAATSPFKSISDPGLTSPHAGMTSPGTPKGITSPIVDGIVGVLCPNSSHDIQKKVEHSPPQFNPFTMPQLAVLQKNSENLHTDELRSLRLALSHALQQNSATSNISPLITKPMFANSVPSILQATQPELNLADLMLNSNLFKLPQMSSTKKSLLPSEYQLLDDAVQPKQEVLSPTSDSKQKLHQCPYCDAKFNQKSNLKTHVFGVHQFKLSTCRTCKIITSKEKLKEHMKTHPNRGFRCHQCDTSFDTHIRLLRHMKIHSAERPYKCTFCPKSFVYKWNLTEHVRIHTGEKPFVCRLCGKGFCQSSTLKRHSLAMHTTEKPYKCSQCDESFVRILLLKKHFVNFHMGGTGQAPSPLLPRPAPPVMAEAAPLAPDALSMLHMFNNSNSSALTDNQFKL